MHPVDLLTGSAASTGAAVEASDGASDGASTGWWHHRFRAMGSTVHVLGFGGPSGMGHEAARRLGELERCWSRFRPDGELVALNADARSVVEVSPDLAEALRRALLAWELTGGRFDPTVHDALVGAGYDRTFAEVRDVVAPPPSSVPVPGCGHIELVGLEVHRPPGLHLDLGGIGKGLAADMVVQHLIDLGVTSASVSVGGDVRVGGVPPDGNWQVPVVDPFAESERLLTVDMAEGAIVTSTTRVRRWQTSDGGWAHHLIDPRTGRPAETGVAAVIVIAADAWWAEVLAKAALVAGPDEGAELLRDRGVHGWIIGDDTEVVAVGDLVELNGAR